MNKAIDQSSDTGSGRYPTGAVLAAMTGGGPATGSEYDDIAARLADPDLTEADLKALEARWYDLTISLSSQLTAREKALKAAKLAAVSHPSWCAAKGQDDQGSHFADSAVIPCTGGAYRLSDDHAAFPWVDVYASQTTGGSGVSLEVNGASDTSPGVTLPPTVAGALAQQVTAQAACTGSADTVNGHPGWCCEPAEDAGHGGGCLSYPEPIYIDGDTDRRVFACAHLRDGRYSVQLTLAFTESDFVEVDLTTTYEAGLLAAALTDSVQLIERG